MDGQGVQCGHMGDDSDLGCTAQNCIILLRTASNFIRVNCVSLEFSVNVCRL
jgi:hypothetical protein